MRHVLYIFLFYGLSGCQALKCLRCTDTLEPRLCNRITSCNKGEVCGLQMFRKDNGDITYWTGCISSQVCTKTANRTIIHTKRQSGFGGDVICSECCKGDLCNSEGCGKLGYPQSRGPLCYDCRDLHSLSDCHKISVCSSNEKCLVEERTIFGQQYFTSRCEHGQTCNSLANFPNIFGRKRATNTCHKCCDGDLCNDNCASAAATLATLTLPAVQTTPNPNVIAFYAEATGSGPLQTRHFTKIYLNAGNAFQASPGKFVCPSDGLYMLVWSATALSEGTKNTVNLMVNGVNGGSVVVDTKSSSTSLYDSSTGFAVLNLHRNDEVMLTGSTQYTIFTGWKISSSGSTDAFYTELSSTYSTSVIPFSTTHLNNGRAFNGTSFHAKQSGLYVFGITGQTYNSKYDDFGLYVNGALSMKVFTDSETSHYDTSSLMSVHKLNAGDVVTVQGHHMEPHRTTFSGYLLASGTAANNRPAFAAYTSDDSTTDPVIFNHEVLDVTNDYDSSTGNFLCSQNGIYVITWAIEANGRKVKTELNLNSGGHRTVVGRTYSAENKNDEYDCGTGVATLQLKKGDTVYVNRTEGSQVEGPFSNFAGWKIF